VQPPPGAPKWKYSQSTGQVSVDILGTETKVGKPGYAGRGTGLNNPAAQNVGTRNSHAPIIDPDNAGPLPRGTYFIGKQQDIKTVDEATGEERTLHGAERLTPEPGTEMFGRDRFIFHGSHDPSRQDSSEGCPVLDFSVRTKIGNSGIPEVEVVE
jgi:hypothetical protein